MPILCPTRRVYGTNEPTGIKAAQRAAYRLARYYYAFKYYLYYCVNIEITIDKSLPPVLLFPCKHKKESEGAAYGRLHNGKMAARPQL